MNKKNRKKKRTRNKRSTRARFPIGSVVRVKPGTEALDSSDISLEGWVGVVQEVDRKGNPPFYLIEWNQETLDRMRAAHPELSEGDDLDPESDWLAEDDLEFNIDETAIRITLPPINRAQHTRNRPEDPIRTIFGLSSADPLPEANEENLLTISDHLAKRLKFPFHAAYIIDLGSFQERVLPVTVRCLLNPDDYDIEEGIMCEAIVAGQPADLKLADLIPIAHVRNSELVQQYTNWLDGASDDSESETDSRQVLLDPPVANYSVRRAEVASTVIAIIFGVIIGTVLNSIAYAWIGACIGIGLGVLVALGNRSQFRKMSDSAKDIPFGTFWGVVFIFIDHVVFGALVGTMVVAFIGLLAGGLFGYLLGKWMKLADGGWTGFKMGAVLGAIAQALYCDHEQAFFGALYGGAIGGTAAIGVMMAMWLSQRIGARWWRAA